MMKVKLDGKWLEVEDTHTYSYLPVLDVDGMELYVAEDSESAGEQARKYWEDLAQDDPEEFACIVGEKTLVQWGMGHSAGPVSTQVKSLQDWLDLWLDTPEENFASYDSHELEVEDCDKELEEELGFKPTVAYRHN